MIANKNRTTAHDELRDKINIVLSALAKRCWWFLARFEFLIKLRDLDRERGRGQVLAEGWARHSLRHSSYFCPCAIPTRVRWKKASGRENLVAIDREQTRQNALFQTSSQHDSIILFIHGVSNFLETSCVSFTWPALESPKRRNCLLFGFTGGIATYPNVWRIRGTACKLTSQAFLFSFSDSMIDD